MLYVIPLSMLKLSLCPLICSVISVLKSKAAGGDGIKSLQEFAKEPNSKVILSCIQCSPGHGAMKECTHMLTLFHYTMSANCRMAFRYQVEMGWKPC